MRLITTCPICGGNIQATGSVYYVDTTLDETGAIVSFGTQSDLGDDVEVYCENDHDHREIMDALLEATTD